MTVKWSFTWSFSPVEIAQKIFVVLGKEGVGYNQSNKTFISETSQSQFEAETIFQTWGWSNHPFFGKNLKKSSWGLLLVSSPDILTGKADWVSYSLSNISLKRYSGINQIDAAISSRQVTVPLGLLENVFQYLKSTVLLIIQQKRLNNAELYRWSKLSHLKTLVLKLLKSHVWTIQVKCMHMLYLFS